MTPRARGRNVRRQTLGVAGLSAVASGTTALVMFLGSSQLSAGWLGSSPFIGSSPGARPLIVDSPAPTRRQPAPPAVDRRTPEAPLTDAPLFVSAIAATSGAQTTPAVVTRPATPPPTPPTSTPPPTSGSHHPTLNGGGSPGQPGDKPHASCSALVGFLGHLPTGKQKRAFKIWAVRHGSHVSNCAVFDLPGFKKEFAKLAKGHGHRPHGSALDGLTESSHHRSHHHSRHHSHHHSDQR
jgi:hypothetical protein